MSSHCLSFSMVSNKKSAVNLTEDPFYMMYYFSLATFKTFFLGFLQFNYNVSSW